MISEEELARLSYPEAPKIVTPIPGPKAQKVCSEALKYQSPTRPSVRSTLVWDEARGANVKDVDGNIFIDLSAGVAVSATGRNHPKVVEAIAKQSEKIMHTAGLVNPVTLELAKKMSNIMPEGLRNNSFSWFGLSGSSAIETAIKYARAITKRSQIIGFEGGYHGVFHGSLALTCRESFRKGYRPFMPEVFHMPYAYCYHCFVDLRYPDCHLACARYLDYKLNTPNTGADDVAAIIIEPMQADGGYIIPPPEYLPMVKKSCEKRGVLFVADEIQCGGGPTGKMWAVEHYGVVPDMITWAKRFGGDQPVSGLTIRADLYDKLAPASQIITAAENALSMAVALANIDIITDKESDLMGRAVVVGKEIKEKLLAAAKTSQIIDEVRGLGFFIGIELTRDKNTRDPLSTKAMGTITKKCEERGVRIMACGRYGSTIRLMPPLIITRAHLNKAIDIMLDVIHKNETELIALR